MIRFGGGTKGNFDNGKLKCEFLSDLQFAYFLPNKIFKVIKRSRFSTLFLHIFVRPSFNTYSLMPKNARGKKIEITLVNYFNFLNLGSYFIKWQRWGSLLSFIWWNKFYNISRNPWKSMIFMIDEVWMKCGALHKGIKFSFSSLKEDRIWPRVWNLNVITNFNLEFGFF